MNERKKNTGWVWDALPPDYGGTETMGNIRMSVIEPVYFSRTSCFKTTTFPSASSCWRVCWLSSGVNMACKNRGVLRSELHCSRGRVELQSFRRYSSITGSYASTPKVASKNSSTSFNRVGYAIEAYCSRPPFFCRRDVSNDSMKFSYVGTYCRSIKQVRRN